MTDPTLTIIVSRTLLGLDPLEFSARLDGTTLGIVQFQPPASQSRNTYMPDSVDVTGSELIGSSEQQAIIGWDWVREIGSTETQVQASRLEVRAAIRQFAFTVTTQISGAPAEVWSADPGSQVPSARDYTNLANRNPVFAVTIPVYPIAS
jgi:hypothetical protein